MGDDSAYAGPGEPEPEEPAPPNYIKQRLEALEALGLILERCRERGLPFLGKKGTEAAFLAFLGIPPEDPPL